MFHSILILLYKYNSMLLLLVCYAIRIEYYSTFLLLVCYAMTNKNLEISCFISPGGFENKILLVN